MYGKVAEGSQSPSGASEFGGRDLDSSPKSTHTLYHIKVLPTDLSALVSDRGIHQHSRILSAPDPGDENWSIGLRTLEIAVVCLHCGKHYGYK